MNKINKKQHYSFYIMGGFGHIKPSQALAEQFAELGYDSRAYDPFSKDGSPVKESANVYNFLTRSPLLLPLWNLVSRHDLLPAWIFQPVHWLEEFFNRDKVNRLRSIIKVTDETIFTATHWAPALVAAKAFPEKTVFLYVTDIHPHGLWRITPPNIHYLVPMEETKIDIQRYGVPVERITVCSFPIHNEIIKNNQRRFVNRIKTLKNKNLRAIDVLVISGGAGTGKAEIYNLLRLFLEPAKKNLIRLTFLVSTPELQAGLISYCAKQQTHKRQVLIDQYSPDSLYVALTKTEILITKAGGDVTFEALAEGVPIYSLHDVGDHERLNRQYLELIGACRPLDLIHQPWYMIEADIISGEVIDMTKASHKNGTFHRSANTPKTILKILEQNYLAAKASSKNSS